MDEILLFALSFVEMALVLLRAKVSGVARSLAETQRNGFDMTKRQVAAFWVCKKKHSFAFTCACIVQCKVAQSTPPQMSSSQYASHSSCKPYYRLRRDICSEIVELHQLF